MHGPHPLPAQSAPTSPPLTVQVGAALAMLVVTLATDQALPGHHGASLFLPASGAALALVLCSGLALLPGIAAGLLIAGALAGQSLEHTLAQALTTVTAVGIAGHWLLRHSPFDLERPHFSTLHHLLLSGCLIGAGAGAIIGNAPLWILDRSAHHDAAWAHIAQSWMGQALGLLLVTPLLLNYRRALLQPLSLQRWREGLLLWLLAAAASNIIFGRIGSPLLAPLDNAYWMFLFVGWSGIRLGLLPTTALLCTIALQALWGTDAHLGFFANDIAATWGFGYWSYMMILGAMGLALAAYMTDLHRSKLQLRIAATAFDMHLALLVTDRHGRILQTNRAFEALTGLAAHDLLGQTPDTLCAISADNPPAAWFASSSNVEHRLQIRSTKGSWLPVWGSISVVRGSKGSISHRVVALADMTDFEAAQARQRQAEQAQRDALVREVHHRIKNNLQGIVGMLRTLAQQHPPLHEAIEQMAAQVQSIAIVHGLQGRTLTEEIELAALVQAVARGVRQTFNTALTVTDTPACAPVLLARAEAVPIALVLNELMTNAIKHGDPTQPAQAALRQDSDGAVITISNAGLWPEASAATALPAGHGLDLVRVLLPRHGARLSHQAHGQQVVTTLALQPPVVHIADG